MSIKPVKKLPLEEELKIKLKEYQGRLRDCLRPRLIPCSQKEIEAIRENIRRINVSLSKVKKKYTSFYVEVYVKRNTPFIEYIAVGKNAAIHLAEYILGPPHKVASTEEAYTIINGSMSLRFTSVIPYKKIKDREELLESLGLGEFYIENSSVLLTPFSYQKRPSIKIIRRKKINWLEFSKRYHIHDSFIELPYINFKNPEIVTGECLPDIFIEKFSTLSRKDNRYISRNTIIPYFREYNLKEVIDFCQEKKISLKCYSLFKKLFVDISQKGKRNIVLIIGYHHANYYVGPTNKIKWTVKDPKEYTIPYYSPGKEINLEKEILPGLDEGDNFNKLRYANFTYFSLRKCNPLSISYENPRFKDYTTEEFDMIKAFHTSLMCAKEKFFPIFTPFDTIEEFNGTIINHGKYFLSSDAPFPKYQRNNIYYGFRLKQNKELIKFVTHQIVPSSSLPSHKIKKFFSKEANHYHLYNGMLGRIMRKPKFIYIEGDSEELAFAEQFHEDLFIKELEDGTFRFGKNIRDYDIYHLNNRSFYEFVIELTNLEVENKYKEISLKYPNYVLSKISTDSIQFYGMEDYREFVDSKWRIKNDVNRNMGKKFKFNYLDPIEYSAALEEEIDNFSIHFYLGEAGSGKTTYIKNNIDYDKCGSFTNVIARMNEGKTIHRELLPMISKRSRYEVAKLKKITYWIDEYSRIPKDLWSLIIAGVAAGCKLILSGDHEHQLLPFNESEDFFNNTFFKIILKKRTEFNEQHRFNKELQEASKNVIETVKSRLTNITTYSDYNLCLTRKRRDEINRNILEMKGLTMESIGCRLRCKRSNSKIGIATGEIYEIINSNDQFIELRRIFPDNEIIRIKDCSLCYFSPGYAFTIDSCQGLTIEEPYTVHEVSKILHFQNAERRLYTALTRGRSLDQVKFIN